MSQYQLALNLSTETKTSIPAKPKRPLTVYNLFSILERNYIVQQNQKQAAISSNTASDSNTDPYASTRPARYRDVVLPSNWFVVGMNRVKRSKHEKHGVISFNDLTKEISLQWKSVDAETKQYCERIAADELERYRKDLAAYKAMYGENVAHAQKLTHKNKCETDCIAEYNEPLSDMVGVMHTPGQATAQEHLPIWNPFQTQMKQSNSGENSHSTCSSNRRKQHIRTLSDYLPDDQEAALALVGNNYDNILPGDELEKAFDSD
eukprot:CCRYP_007652-RA/>CCRYP_007652-RA protein AED:0.39 eAED:0.39 QI:137/1/0.5/1/1/1/2/0/262